MLKNPHKYVGEDVIKVDAQAKTTGEAVYPNDIYMDDMLYARVKRAPHPHAYLKELDISKAEALPEVVKVITAADFPDLKNFGLIVKDQPVLIGIGEKMRYMGDTLAIVVAETRDAAQKGISLIETKVEELEVIDNPLRAMEDDAPALHNGENILDNNDLEQNIVTSHILKRGDIDKGFAEADFVVENEYTTQHIEQLPLQNESGVAYYDREDDQVKLWVATQWIHDTQADIAQSIGFKKDQVRIIQPAIGGAFGKKEDISVHIHLVLAALETGRPVKMAFSRKESMIAQSKRHPIIIRLKTGVKNDGRLTAVKAEVIGDTGAYASSGPAVVHKGLFHCTGPYNVENISGRSYTVYTNNTYGGAMRGFGALQTAFAYDSQMDIIADKLDMDPLEYRYQNAYEKGSKTPNGQILNNSVNAKETLKEAKDMIEKEEGHNEKTW